MAVRRSQQAVSLTLNVGARLPLFHSAIGRAALCAMPREEREHIMRQAADERPEEADAVRESVEKGLEDYGRYGFCTSFGSWRGEINGIAVPVISLNGDRVYGLNVGGPAFLVQPEELLRDYGDRLLAAGERLSNANANAQQNQIRG
jgi:DNA-binding IclR family transcriptional regulator